MYREIWTERLLIVAVFCVLLGLALVGCASSAQPTDKYEAAYAQWKHSDRPLVLWYGAEWCGPCRTAHAQYEAEIRSGAIVVTLDIDKDAALIASHHLPTPARIPGLAVYQPAHLDAKRWHPGWYHGPQAFPHLFVGLPGFGLYLGR